MRASSRLRLRMALFLALALLGPACAKTSGTAPAAPPPVPVQQPAAQADARPPASASKPAAPSAMPVDALPPAPALKPAVQPAQTPFLPDRPPLFAKFYYGALDDVNHSHSIDESVQVLSRFDLLVIDPAGSLSAQERAVVRQLLNLRVQLFGYVHLGMLSAALSDAEIAARIDQCADLGYTGIFFDEAGYDYQVTRSRLNLHVDHAHRRGLKVIANAWVPQDVLSGGPENAMNPAGTESSLGAGDWILLESFYSRSDNSYAGATDGMAATVAKYVGAVTAARGRAVNVLGLAYHNMKKPFTDTTDRDNSYLLALLLGLDGWAYGASADNDLVPWTGNPELSIGSGRLGDLKQVSNSPLRWERRTNRGAVWFEATSNPATRSSGLAIDWEPAAGGGMRLYP